LVRVRSTWIRGFVDYFDFSNGKKNIQTDSGLAKFHDAHQAGYKTIVNIKFDFSDLQFPPSGKPFPTTDTGIDAALSYLDTFLSAVYPDCDILVVGNEPFIESQTDDRGQALVQFYEVAAAKVKAFQDTQRRKIPLYLGAYDSIWVADPWQQQGAPLLEFTKETPWLQGADLHIHQYEDADIDEAFAFVEPKLRSDQKILVTEFSQVNYYKQYNSYFIPEILITQYDRPDDWFVFNYLDSALKSPVGLPEWIAFLQNSDWFESTKHYLNVAWAKFNSHPKFAIATYGMYQSGPQTFTAGDQPWILNALFVNQTVVPEPSTGGPQFNYTFADDFLALQAGISP